MSTAAAAVYCTGTMGVTHTLKAYEPPPSLGPCIVNSSNEVQHEVIIGVNPQARGVEVPGWQNTV